MLRLICSIRFCFITIILFSNFTAFAQEKTELESVIVTATRTETLAENLPNSVTVISAKDIEQKGQSTLYDVLKDVPGLSIYQCGGPGQWTKVQMRGGQDRHIKLLINGSAVGDQATGTTPHYDLWNMLNTENIERIEVIRGAQSALYGADAISGVINIITKKGKGTPQFYLKTIGGSMDTWRTSSGVNGSQGKTDYNLTVSHNQTGGVLPNDESEDDAVAARLGYQFTDNTRLNFSAQFSDTMVNLGQTASSPWKLYDDPNAYRYGELFFSSLDLTQKLTSFWDHKITLGFDNIRKRHDDIDDGVLDAADGINDSFKKSLYVSTTQKASWQNNFYIDDFDTFTAGVEYEGVDVDRDHLTSSSHKVYGDTINTKAVYLQNQLLLFEKALSFNLGGRIDDHSSFGTHSTYNIGLSYRFREIGTKIRGTYGTGFTAPSIFQLYDPTYGNEALSPEESKTWEMGVEQQLFGEKVIVEATYFHNDFENLIAYDASTTQYTNRDVAKSYGVETGVSIYPVEDVSISVSYTFTDGEEDGADLANVPKDDWKFGMAYSPDKFRISTDVYLVGDRLAYDQKEEHRLDSYCLVNIAGSYIFNRHLTLLAQVDNLFDENYESSARYYAPGRSFYGGIKVSF